MTYPSSERRLTYTYTDVGKPLTLHFDWSQLYYHYHPITDTLHSMNLTDGRDYHCQMLFGSGNALVDRHYVYFNGTKKVDLLNAEYSYNYDRHFRVSSVQSRIGPRLLPIVNSTYDINSGKILRIKNFQFEYPGLHREVIKDTNIEIIREYDSLGRLTDIWYRFNNYVVFTLEVKYDTSNRVHQWRRKVGSSDQKTYEYTYDIDDTLVEVEVNDQPTWGYEVDANNNIVQTRQYDTVHELAITDANQLETRGTDIYVFDEDGFLVKRKDQHFTYNALGQLERTYENGKYDVRYYYDSFGRLTARHDVMDNFITQFFYSDLRHRNQISHIYQKGSGGNDKQLLTQLYYDGHGQLFALEQDGTFFYVALDPIGSPILVYNAVGSVVKQMNYDPLGKQITDTSPDFFFVLGYRCGVVDHITQLIHLEGRMYDPETGRWTSPDYEGLLRNTGRLSEEPQLLNLYQHHNLVNRQPLMTHKNTGEKKWKACFIKFLFHSYPFCGSLYGILSLSLI